jgi:DNA-binding transcriptional regulator YiaG
LEKSSAGLVKPSFKPPEPWPVKSSPRGRVALLGIAQRTVMVKYASKTRKSPHSKPLPESIKTIGDWILVKRMAKNLTTGHLALKMGITTSLVYSWENGTDQPNSQQLKILSSVLGFDSKDFAKLNLCQKAQIQQVNSAG